MNKMTLRNENPTNFFESLHKEEWKEVRLGEVAELNPKESLQKNAPYKKVSMDNLEPFNKKIYSYSLESFKGGSRFRNGDTLLARITPCLENGKTAFVDFLKENEIAFGSTEFIVLREKEKVSDKNFIYYLTRSERFRQTAIKSMTGSSGRERVQIDVLLDFTFPLPPLPIQNQIAEILSSFDDKIDLLHRQNQTLESLALTLFRHSFIENPKNPISENVNNRDKFGGETLVAQMESQNLSSAVKTAPPMWKMGKLGEEFDFIMGVSPEGSSYNENQRGIPMFQGNADFGFRFPSNRIYTTKPKRSAQAFDILISVRAPVGDVNMAKESCCIGRGLAAFKHKLDRNLYSYTFYKLKSLSQEIQQFNDKGTIFGSISKGDFENIDVPIPPLEIVKELNQQLKVFDDKIYNNSQQIQS